MVPAAAAEVVLDTNIVLDLWVFSDPASQPLRDALAAQTLVWIGTPPMREELARVLAYPAIAARLDYYQRSPAAVLAQWDAHCHVREPAARARFVCKDPDDQKFVDLAVAHQARLLSKDKAVLCMARRLRTLGVWTARSLDLASA